MTTTYSYDELSRVTSRSYSGGGITTPGVSYAYDTATRGVGRLASVTASGVSTYNYTAYDALGRVSAYSQTTDTQTYQMSAAYNKASLMVSETYPSNKVVETGYDAAGRLAGVKKQGGAYYAGAGASDANRLKYTAHGAVAEMRLGNNLWEYTIFNSRLQPTQIGFGINSTSTSVLGLDYTYGSTDNNGNVRTQRITAPGLDVTQSYSYDHLNRLMSASEGSNWMQSYGYDQAGNRWVSSGYVPNTGLTPQGQSAFNASTNRLVASLYDVAGNQTRDAESKRFGYDGENRQVSFNEVEATYSYDGDGRRVKKTDSTGTTVFVYNASGQLVAEYTTGSPQGSGTSYLTTDHLGSTRVVTDGNGNVKARHDFLPYGEEIATSIGSRSSVAGYGAADSTRQKFTSKERDGESGLDYFLARYYSSAQGRFTSPDEFTGGPDELYYFAEDASKNPTFYADLRNPQSLNKYQYCFNNPLRYVDPDGHDPLAEPDPDDDKPTSAAKGAAIGAGAGAVIGGAVGVVVGGGGGTLVAPGIGTVGGAIGGGAVGATKGAGIGAVIGGAIGGIIGWITGEDTKQPDVTVQEQAQPQTTTPPQQQAQPMPPPAPMQAHGKGKRESTRGKHERGEARTKRDYGRERGDIRRGWPRKPPPGHKGPWPPKQPKKPQSE